MRSRTAARALMLTVALAATTVAGLPAAAAQEQTSHRPTSQDSPSVANPVVEGPITGGTRGGAYNRTRVPLLKGYVEQEFFLSGNAEALDGVSLPYKTRIHVRRPASAADFNGGVVLDWTNTSVPDDTDVNWVPMHTMLMERGYVYVAVAAQRLAIDAVPFGLRAYDPARYGSLTHPSDQFAYDMFAQAAESVLNPAVLGALAGKVNRRLAAGASQSAIKLTDYVNDWHAGDRVFDGFLPQLNDPNNIRHDLVPVLFLNSQNELRDAEPVADSGRFVLWEMAGPSHAPFGYGEYQNSGYVFHTTNGAVNLYDHETAVAWGYQNDPGECTSPNTFDAGHLYSAALVALDRWVLTGKKPAGHRVDRTGGVLHYDDQDNIVGGLRSPLVQAPIAHYFSGGIPDDASACGALAPAPLIGSTQNLSADELRARYGTSKRYASQFEAAVVRALAEKTLLPENAAELRRRLKRATAWVGSALGETSASPPEGQRDRSATGGTAGGRPSIRPEGRLADTGGSAIPPVGAFLLLVSGAGLLRVRRSRAR